MLKSKKLSALLACVIVISMLLAACGGPSAPAPAPETPTPADNQPAAEGGTGDARGPEGAEVTLILKNFANPFFITMREGAEAAAEHYGINLTVLAPLVAESNEEQSQMSDQAIINQVDLLIMCPSDTYGIIPAIQRVHEAGIPIVALNTRIGGEVLWETFVAIENFYAGYEATTRLAEMMGGEGDLILLEGVPGAQSSIDRMAGAHAALENFPNINLVAQQTAEFNRAIAMDVMQNLLQAHPGVSGVYAANDEMALGALEAIEAAGLGDQILVGGTDANADARQAMRDGRLALTVSTDPFAQGFYSVQAAAAVLRGETLPDFYTVPIRVLSSVEELDAFEAQ